MYHLNKNGLILAMILCSSLEFQCGLCHPLVMLPTESVQDESPTKILIRRQQALGTMLGNAAAIPAFGFQAGMNGLQNGINGMQAGMNGMYGPSPYNSLMYGLGNTMSGIGNGLSNFVQAFKNGYYGGQNAMTNSAYNMPYNNPYSPVNQFFQNPMQYAQQNWMNPLMSGLQQNVVNPFMSGFNQMSQQLPSMNGQMPGQMPGMNNQMMPFMGGQQQPFG